MTYFTLVSTAASPTTNEEGVSGPAAQQRVQVGKLAALALVTHPDLFLGVPPARAVEQKEDVVPVLIPANAVFRIQPVDSRAGELYQRIIPRK